MFNAKTLLIISKYLVPGNSTVMKVILPSKCRSGIAKISTNFKVLKTLNFPLRYVNQI